MSPILGRISELAVSSSALLGIAAEFAQVAMSNCEQQRSDQGLEVIQLQNKRLRVSVLPGVGGKISELVDLASGRNWLWQNDAIPFAKTEYDANFDFSQDSGGWDDILLSMTPAAIELPDQSVRRIPDHGDLVGQEWLVSDSGTESEGQAYCQMSVRGRAIAYDLRKTIRLHPDKPRLEVSYVLHNDESVAWPWYWSAHALFAADPDLYIDLPDAQEYRVEKILGGESAHGKEQQRWPIFRHQCGRNQDLSRSYAKSDEQHRIAGKFFVRAPETGRIVLARCDGDERLTMSFDRDLHPWLGLWINNGAWSGAGSEPYCNLGVEPATVPYDSVCDAIRQEAVSWVQPGESKRWSLAVELA